MNKNQSCAVRAEINSERTQGPNVRIVSRRKQNDADDWALQGLWQRISNLCQRLEFALCAEFSFTLAKTFGFSWRTSNSWFITL